ncbi:MAG TPA: glycosyl hydrolase [Verrucomicrobiales bacterium]|nr:glycosyl hydrolase [Verrucomicrobiales bacterium]
MAALSFSPVHEIKMRLITLLLLTAAFAAPGFSSQAKADDGPIRVLFLGHESEHHNSNLYYPMLSRALGRNAIYFDYVTSVEEALGDADYLGKFDALLLYANHGRIEPHQWKNLKEYVEGGGGFVPVHCASWCFGNEPGFDKLVGGRFKSHQGAEFAAKIVKPNHPAMKDVKEFTAWDETYFHNNHNTENRTVLMVREAMPGDPHTKPEPWTWVRTQGKGRVFYTASGHDQRVWSHSDFHQLIKSGILWSVGDKARKRYDNFIAKRTPLKYEKRGNIPNYERRPEPLQYQLPLSPEDSMKYTQVPVGFRMELFAAEPDVINPIYMAWDERGRLWVVETVDYPNEFKDGRKGNDRIKICEDTDGDGKADKFTVFAEGFNIPTSMTFARGGIILAHAPEFYFLKDTDGDDKADVREVLFTGWGVGDTHAGPSNLRYGFDNWIYGTVGYARFTGSLGGKQQNFGMGVFRFKPDASDIEFLHQFNNNTWGLGFNAAGDVFGSTANNNPTFFGGIPATVFGENRQMSAKMIADSRSFHPITPNIRQVDAFNAYTAGCGHAFATSAAFPKKYRDRAAFICGPTGNLLGSYYITQKGAGYSAKNGFSFVASADEWFSPIVAEVGPDGHLWIADWYNFIIQHNPTPSIGRGGYAARNGRGNAHINPNRDRQHGRIYRVVWEGAQKSKITSLANASPLQLVEALDNDNLFWRQTAQRLIVNDRMFDKVEALQNRVLLPGVGAIHALWALKGLDKINENTIKSALKNKDAAVRRNAVRALENKKTDEELLYNSSTLTDKDLLVRLSAIVKLAQFNETLVHKRAAGILSEDKINNKDEWLKLALKAAGAEKANIIGYEKGPNLLQNTSFESHNDQLPTNWKIRTYSGNGTDVKHSIEKRNIHIKTGKASLKIQSESGHDTSLFTTVKLNSGSTYAMSAWIKTQGVKGGHGALLNIHELQHNGKSSAVKGDNDWKKVELVFESNQSGSFTLNCLFGGWGKAKGTAWFDDISLNEVKPILDNNIQKNDKTEIAAKVKNIYKNNVYIFKDKFKIKISTVKDKMMYDVKEFSVETGRLVSLQFVNKDLAPHNLLIVKPGKADEVSNLAISLAEDGPKKEWRPDTPLILWGSKMINQNQSDEIIFNAPDPGIYPFICTYPGHSQMMRGIMKVKKPK